MSSSKLKRENPLPQRINAMKTLTYAPGMNAHIRLMMGTQDYESYRLDDLVGLGIRAFRTLEWCPWTFKRPEEAFSKKRFYEWKAETVGEVLRALDRVGGLPALLELRNFGRISFDEVVQAFLRIGVLPYRMGIC